MAGAHANAQSKYEADVARQNAALSVEAANDSITRGKLEAKRFYREAGQVKGQQVAAMAANGIDVGRGTALTVQQDTQMLIDEDANDLYSNIHERTRGFDINAQNYRIEAKAARSRGKAAMTAAMFEAAGSLMSGMSQAGALKAKFGTPSGSTSRLVSNYAGSAVTRGRLFP